MPYISKSSYKSPYFLYNGHIQTIFPALFRKVKTVKYNRERIITPDDDFLDLDWSAQNTQQEKLIILTHGLEGNSSSRYILGMVRALNNVGFDTLSWNMRSCSGEINKQLRFYHSGAYEDLDFVIRHASKTYSKIYLVGFSLGGNITLKYLGTKGKELENSNIVKCLTFSVPCHLESSALKLAKRSNKIYLKRFLKSLKAKIIAKNELLPNQLNIDNILNIKDFFDFDNEYTGPIHGFKNAHDYYSKCSSVFVLDKITIPTLLINAQNDPFLSPECFPYEQAFESSYFHLETPNSGGHCGFITLKNGTNWAEERAVKYFLDK